MTTGTFVSGGLTRLLGVKVGSPLLAIERVTFGKDGRACEILKLRTMVAGAEFTGAGLAIAEGDARITRLGRLLRRYSLDELPNRFPSGTA